MNWRKQTQTLRSTLIKLALQSRGRNHFKKLALVGPNWTLLVIISVCKWNTSGKSGNHGKFGGGSQYNGSRNHGTQFGGSSNNHGGGSSSNQDGGSSSSHGGGSLSNHFNGGGGFNQLSGESQQSHGNHGGGGFNHSHNGGGRQQSRGNRGGKRNIRCWTCGKFGH